MVKTIRVTVKYFKSHSFRNDDSEVALSNKCQNKNVELKGRLLGAGAINKDCESAKEGRSLSHCLLS